MDITKTKGKKKIREEALAKQLWLPADEKQCAAALIEGQ